MSRFNCSSRRGQAGFTLVEVLVVVAIVGLLAAGAGGLLREQRNNSYDTVAKSELKSLANNIGSAIVFDNADIRGGSGVGEPLIVDGVEVPQNGAYVFVDAAAKAYCVSKQSQSGRIWSIDSIRGVLFESAGWCTSATQPPEEGTNSEGAVVSLSGNLLDPDQAEPELSGFVESSDIGLEETVLEVDASGDSEDVGSGTVPDGEVVPVEDSHTSGLEATVSPDAASAAATTVQPDEGACGNLDVVPGKIYHVEAFIESAPTNSRPANVLM